jgi:tetratricopeptide (TPR) repeat protein
LHALLTTGDLSAAEGVATKIEYLAEQSREPEYLRLGTMYRGLVAGIEGKWEEAENLAARNLGMMQDARHPHAGIVYMAQLLPCRWLQGRASELSPLLDYSIEVHQHRVLLPCVKAWTYCDHDPDRARVLLEAIEPEWFTDRERDFDWFTISATTAMTVEALHDVTWTKWLYPALLPYADRNCVAGQSAFLGTMEYHLGSLAVVAGDWDKAIAHLDRALDRHESIRARPFLALTQQTQARALLGRDAAGDADRARTLLRRAARTTRELNLGAVASRLKQLNIDTRRVTRQ